MATTITTERYRSTSLSRGLIWIFRMRTHQCPMRWRAATCAITQTRPLPNNNKKCVQRFKTNRATKLPKMRKSPRPNENQDIYSVCSILGNRSTERSCGKCCCCIYTVNDQFLCISKDILPIWCRTQKLLLSIFHGIQLRGSVISRFTQKRPIVILVCLHL